MVCHYKWLIEYDNWGSPMAKQPYGVPSFKLVEKLHDNVAKSLTIGSWPAVTFTTCPHRWGRSHVDQWLLQRGGAGPISTYEHDIFL